MNTGSLKLATEELLETPPVEPSRLAPMWLLLASCASSYLAFLAACAGQFLLPALVAAWQGGVMLEEVRITPLWLVAWGSGREAAVRWLFRYGPLLFGGSVALAAMAGARIARGRGALILHLMACWNLALLLAVVIPWLLFWRRTWEGFAQILVIAPLLLLALRGLVSFAAPYTSARFPRAAAALLAFYIPFMTILVVFWRVNLRLPFRGAQNLWTFLGVLATLGVLAFLGAALGRRPGERNTWPLRATLNYLAVAVALLVALAAYGRLQTAVQDRQLARFSTPHYEFLYPAASYLRERVEQLAREREALWPALVARLGSDAAAAAESLRLRVFLFPSLQAKYERTRSTLPFSVEGRDIFAVLNEQLSALDPRADAQALVAATWGKAALPFLEDAAASFVSGGDAARGAGRITAEEGPYSLTQSSDAEAFVSPLVRRPLAAEFAAWLGGERLRQLYAAGLEPGGADWRLPLEDGWRRRLRELASRWTPPPGRPFAPSFHKGMAFSHEGGARTGYASQRAAQVLTQLPALGVDSVALMPFAFMASPEASSLRRFAGESDQALEHMTFVAHRAGLRVLLKPQIWLRGGRFSGDIRFRNEQDFRAWWSAYRQWILHYARLAELNGTDLLAVGTELQGVSGREADWRSLIAEIRRVYHGPITYASNWGAEFETLRFWDAVDYIGLNAYYPLAGQSSAEALAGNIQAGAFCRDCCRPAPCAGLAPGTSRRRPWKPTPPGWRRASKRCTESGASPSCSPRPAIPATAPRPASPGTRTIPRRSTWNSRRPAMKRCSAPSTGVPGSRGCSGGSGTARDSAAGPKTAASAPRTSPPPG